MGLDNCSEKGRRMANNGTLRIFAGAVCALLTVGLAGCGESNSPAGNGGNNADKKYVIGVSNTLVGNGWREEMICSVKAEALASGMVSEVIVANRNAGPTEQIADLQNLISAGAN